MRVVVGMLFTLVALAGPVAAGELLLANGSRLEADLANDVLVISTGADLVEVAPDAVARMTPAEIHLKDGRVLRGTLVGGRVKARTALGELTITVDELRVFDAATAGTSPAVPPTAPTAPASSTASDDGLPAVTLYQPAPATPEPPKPATAAATPGDGAAGVLARPAQGERLQVVTEQSALHRDALSAATPVGRVTRGETVTYIDSIDRRLRIFNTVIFDGGYWIKVRAADGTEGWLPASTVRGAR